ncbi:MAG TPA: class I SAM-dependent methyltransferase [Stellaceae bacterium]|nr:class I SAM-dependent methyltransferase [Stellaceae bacterium]
MARSQASDPYDSIRAGTDAHRRAHGCRAYPFSEGPLLGVIAAACDAKRILELGTALGYTALWLAHGAPAARVDTIERDPEHVRIARENFAAAGCGARITAHLGDFESVLPKLTPEFDLGFFDGFGPTLAHLAEFRRLLRPRGVLVSTNLDVGRGDDYRAALADPARWLTSFAAEDGRTAISIKL